MFFSAILVSFFSAAQATTYLTLGQEGCDDREVECGVGLSCRNNTCMKDCSGNKDCSGGYDCMVIDEKLNEGKRLFRDKDGSKGGVCEITCGNWAKFGKNGGKENELAKQLCRDENGDFYKTCTGNCKYVLGKGSLLKEEKSKQSFLALEQ